MVPISCNEQGAGNQRITLQYVLYLMLREGMGRVRANKAPALELGGYRRGFQWFDGKPSWYATGQQRTWDHPGGYTRQFNFQQRAWYWALNGAFQAWGTPSLHA